MQLSALGAAELNQGLIRLKFELEDLEGQSEDILSHLDQARKQNEELIRKQAKAEAEKEKITDVLRRLLTKGRAGLVCRSGHAARQQGLQRGREVVARAARAVLQGQVAALAVLRAGVMHILCGGQGGDRATIGPRRLMQHLRQCGSFVTVRHQQHINRMTFPSHSVCRHQYIKIGRAHV